MRWRQLLAASVAVFALVALADVCGLALRPAHAASEFERGLKRHLLKAVAIDRDLDAKLRQVWGWDTTPAQLAVLRPYMRAVFRHPQFPGYLAGKIEALGPVRSLSPVDVRNASTLGMLKLQASGLARLPSDDQAVYVRHLLAMVRELPANTCQEVSDPDTTALRHAQIERESLMRIPVAKLADYYKVAERAALWAAPILPDTPGSYSATILSSN